MTTKSKSVKIQCEILKIMREQDNQQYKMNEITKLVVNRKTRMEYQDISVINIKQNPVTNTNQVIDKSTLPAYHVNDIDIEEGLLDNTNVRRCVNSVLIKPGMVNVWQPKHHCYRNPHIPRSGTTPIHQAKLGGKFIRFLGIFRGYGLIKL